MFKEKEKEAAEPERPKPAADAVIEAMIDPVVVLDLEGNVTSINPAYEKIFGHKREESIGRHILELLGMKSVKLEDIEKIMPLLKETIEKGSAAPVEFVFPTEDGKMIPISVVGGVIKDAQSNPTHVVAVLRDITELKRAEEERITAEKSAEAARAAAERARAEEAEKYSKELEKAYEELKTLAKMKSDFIHIAAHELRTPLTPIKAYVDLIKAEKLGRITWQQKEKLEIASENLDRLARLIDDMLDTIRIETRKLELRKEWLSIGEVVDIALDNLKSIMLDRKRRISIHVPDNLPTVYADKELITKVFVNLLSNAVKYTTSTTDKITVEAREEEKNIHITVADTGIGIPVDKREKIFEKFYLVDSSLTRRHRGIGLGLAIAKGIVEEHGGKIWAESEGLGKGSTFHVVLPTMKRSI
ncbi:MAG: ATP-binding protein [Candidatus Thermoplasmatota archaeon]